MELCVGKVLKSKRKREVQGVYISSFPEKERMPFVLL